MVDVSGYTGSKFIRVDDVREGSCKEKIINVYEGERYKKLILELDSGREFTLNVTNTKALAKAYGKESDRWLGHTIELSFGHIMFEGKETETVIITPVTLPTDFPDGKPPDAPEPRPATQSTSLRDQMDDEIPF